VRSLDPSPWSTCLASGYTVRRYSEMVQSQDRAGIADLIRKRFVERYLNPILDNPERHGFAMLAICCLMVETLESFRQGWEDTSERGRSEAAFCSFFQAHNEFRDLRPVAHDFYRAVRCGILHQAETTQKWRVDREPGLVVEQGGVHWLSAFEFGNGLRAVLDRYHDELSNPNSDWKGPLWVKARKKLQAISKNCGLPDREVSKLA